MTRAITLETWQRLLAPEYAELVAAAATVDPTEVAAVAALRRLGSADLVAAAIELGRARARAARKFEAAGDMVADTEGVEQATSELVARHKSERYRALAPAEIWDLCSGIGGDARALVTVASVVAVERDPVRAWMTGRNARCEVRCVDVESLGLSGEVIHIDPGRRKGGRRTWQYQHYEPSPTVIEAILTANPDAAVKLGPGIEFDELPDPDSSEIELISAHGELVQAVLWHGELARAPGQRTATRLPAGVSLTGHPRAPPASGAARAGPVGTEVIGVERFLVAADPALERAGLLGVVAVEHGLREVAPGLGLLTSEVAPDSPWLSSFEVVEVLSGRLSRVRDWLAAHDGGPVEVKTRGGAADANHWQRQLNGPGGATFTIFVLRIGKPVHAVITRRVDADPRLDY